MGEAWPLPLVGLGGNYNFPAQGLGFMAPHHSHQLLSTSLTAHRGERVLLWPHLENINSVMDVGISVLKAVFPLPVSFLRGRKISPNTPHLGLYLAVWILTSSPSGLSPSSQVAYL